MTSCPHKFQSTMAFLGLTLTLLVSADIYLHNPAGSNNRNRERNANRNNANRLFDSQNNDKVTTVKKSFRTLFFSFPFFFKLIDHVLVDLHCSALPCSYRGATRGVATARSQKVRTPLFITRDQYFVSSGLISMLVAATQRPIVQWSSNMPVMTVYLGLGTDIPRAGLLRPLQMEEFTTHHIWRQNLPPITRMGPLPYHRARRTTSSLVCTKIMTTTYPV